MKNISEFFAALFGEVPPGNYILIWRIADKSSHWFSRLDNAAAFADVNSDDVYFGVGLSPRNYGKYSRCPANDISGIGALWMDLDYRDPVHNNKELPSQEQLTEFLDNLAIQPTVIVHTGHGYQVYWNFPKLWMFANEQERQEAANLAYSLQSYIQQEAAAEGWIVDSTFDLARILRVPFTVNAKAEPVPVTVVSYNPGNRYSREDFAHYFPIKKLGAENSSNEIEEIANSFEFNVDAQPPFSKFQALSKVIPRVSDTWNYNRPDFADQSPSAFDMSLATYAAEAGWSNQEIVDLMLSARREHGADLKLRKNYYARTIYNARKAVKQKQAKEELGTVDSADKEAAFDLLESFFGFRITRIFKYVGAQSVYYMECGDVAFPVGDVNVLINQNLLRPVLADHMGVYIPMIERARWPSVAQLLLDLCEHVSLGEDVTECGPVLAWVDNYLHSVIVQPNIQEAYASRLPFVQDGRTYLFLSSFRQWLILTEYEHPTVRILAANLRFLGAIPTILSVYIDSEQTTRSVWDITALLRR